MKHSYSMEGYAYRLRPVAHADAAFIVKIRLEDQERNRFLHPISNDIKAQERWLDDYFTREDDYYFVVENILTGESEGLISIYNGSEGRAEWGRWVLRSGSLAALESFCLICRIAFEKLHLDEIYSLTIEDNLAVVSFHDSILNGGKEIIPGYFSFSGYVYNAVKHRISKNDFYSEIAEAQDEKAHAIFRRNLRALVGRLRFEHIGVACKNIDKEFATLKLLGYKKDGPAFIDENQGITGQFLKAKEQPRLELLQNLEGRETLNVILSNGIKLYHFAYLVDNFDLACKVLLDNRGKLVSPAKQSVYYGKRICFIMLKNMLMLELIES